MKIAIFSDTFLPQINGVATVTYKSALALGNLGHEVRVLTVSKNGGDDFKNITQGKFTVTTLPSVGFPIYPGERVAIPLGISVQKISEFRPDIIHTHTPFTLGWEAVACAKLFKIPLVGTHHTFYDHYLKLIKMDYEWAKKPSWKYIIAYYNRCNLIISPTQFLADSLKSHGLRKPIDILPNSVDTECFYPAASATHKKKLKSAFGINDTSLIYMGRVSYEKSIDQLVWAFYFALQKFPELTLMIVGDGPEKMELQKLVRDLEISDKIIFTGILRGEKLLEALQANDAFITASKSENMPMAILEAMAAGLPIIAVRALGIPETVKDNENGFLSAPDNQKEMAEKIIELAGNPKRMEKFSLASRRLTIDNYSQEKVAELLQNIYQKLL